MSWLTVALISLLALLLFLLLLETAREKNLLAKTLHRLKWHDGQSTH